MPEHSSSVFTYEPPHLTADQEHRSELWLLQLAAVKYSVQFSEPLHSYSRSQSDSFSQLLFENSLQDPYSFSVHVHGLIHSSSVLCAPHWNVCVVGVQPGTEAQAVGLLFILSQVSGVSVAFCLTSNVLSLFETESTVAPSTKMNKKRPKSFAILSRM